MHDPDRFRNPRDAARVSSGDDGCFDPANSPTLTDETTDESLAARAAGGDDEAFRTLYFRHRTMVHSLSRKLVGDADAEDVLQQAFLRVHRALPRFRGESKLSTWIYQVALSTALTARKRRSREPGALDVSESVEPAASGPSPGESAAARDEAAWVRRHLEALPRRDRAILHMRYQEGRPFEEIARILEVPVGTAKSLVFRAKAELRRNMERERDAM